MHIAPLLPKLLDESWPFLADMVRQVALGSEGRMDETHIYQGIKRGEYVAWVVLNNKNPQALVIARIVQYPLKRVLRLIGCVGSDHKKWAHLIEDIEDWARNGGFASVVIESRPGWSRVFRDYKTTHYVMVKEL